MKVEPSEPWHSPAEATTHTFVLNPTNLGLLSVAFISLGVILLARRRGKPRRGIKVMEAVPGEEILEMAKEFEAKPTDIKTRIIEAYLGAQRTVEGVTKVSMRPYMTLREFLKEVIPKLGEAAEPFSELT